MTINKSLRKSQNHLSCKEEDRTESKKDGQVGINTDQN